jgi:hypothetical protein
MGTPSLSANTEINSVFYRERLTEDLVLAVAPDVVLQNRLDFGHIQAVFADQQPNRGCAEAEALRPLAGR